MLTERKSVPWRRVTLAFVAAAAVFFAGCQTHSYTDAENDIYNHFEKWAVKLPGGMRPAPPQQSADGAAQYSYRDGEPSGRRREIKCVIQADKRQLVLVDIEAPQADRLRFLGFWAGPVEINFNEARQCKSRNPLIADLTYLLQSDSEATVYFRRKATGTWRRCRLPMMVFSALTPDNRCECLKHAQKIRPEQVQRYADLADRFFTKYFFLE